MLAVVGQLYGQAPGAIPRVVYASSIPGIHADGSLSSNSGTDDKAALQKVLNTASAHTPLELVLDGMFLIDTRDTGLIVFSHTTIRGLGWSTGFSWLGGKALHQQPLITNLNPMGIGTPIDTDIVLRDFAINGNYKEGHGGVNAHQIPAIDNNSDGLYLAEVRIVGASHITMDNLYCVLCTGLNMHFANIFDFRMENLRFNASGAFYTGGLQIEGPASNGQIRNISGTMPDDLVALNADDGHLASCVAGTTGAWGDNLLPSTIKNGPITDILIDGIHSENSYEALRLLSATSLMDGITIRNLKGTTFGHILSADLFPPCFGNVFPGNFGRIDISDVQVRPSNITNEYGLGAISLQAHFRSLRLDVNLMDYAPVTAAPVVLLNNFSSIDNLMLSFVASSESSAALNGPLVGQTGGSVDNLEITGSYDSHLPSSNAVVDTSGGSIQSLIVSGYYKGVNNVLYQHGGSINTVNFGPGRHLAAPGHGSVNQAGGNTIEDAMVAGWGAVTFHEGSGTISDKQKP